MKILNDTLRTQLYQLIKKQNYYARFFSINPEYNEDTKQYLKVYHLITMNNSEETRIEINNKKPKKHGYYNRPWTKTRKALGIKAVLGRMPNLMKKNSSVHCATNNWMIVIEDGKAKGHRMITGKIIELDQLLIPSSQMTKKEVERFMKKIKNNNKGWITLEKKI